MARKRLDGAADGEAGVAGAAGAPLAPLGLLAGAVTGAGACE
jgi:hypothetical protein